MTTVFNPLSNRLVKESGVIGSIIKTIKDWVDDDKIKQCAKRMLGHYRLKRGKNWKDDFLKIVEYYSPSHIQQATSIANSVNEEEQQRINNVRFSSEYFLLTMVLPLLSREAPPKTPTKQTISKFLDKSTVTDTQCECAICLDFEGNHNVVELPCKHKYHRECISQWLQKVNNCPLCKRQCMK
jgi:hypothetical protein